MNKRAFYASLAMIRKIAINWHDQLTAVTAERDRYSSELDRLLQRLAPYPSPFITPETTHVPGIVDQALGVLTAVTAERDRMREALEKISSNVQWHEEGRYESIVTYGEVVDIARRALRKDEQP